MLVLEVSGKIYKPTNMYNVLHRCVFPQKAISVLTADHQASKGKGHMCVRTAMLDQTKGPLA